MKTSLLLTSFAIVGLSTGIQAQVVANGGFENWGSPSGEPQEPTSWVTGNVLATPPFFSSDPTSVFKATAVGEFHGGTAAMKITTVKLNTNPMASSGFNDTVALAVTGTVVMSPSISLKQGFAFTGRPDKLDFWYKYTPTGTDNGGALAVLTKWTGTKRDTVAEAYFYETNTVSTMTSKSITLVYRPAYNNSGNPDTAIVGFSPSIGTIIPQYPVRPKLGSVMWVDDADLTGTHVGIKEVTKSSDFHVYPNPATTAVNFSFTNEENGKVELYDVTGKKVGASNIEDKKARISTEGLSNGLYIYRIMDNDKKVIGTGKVNVDN